jgi:hypothetical protein
MGVDKSIIGRIFSRPLLWLATRPPEKGAKTPIFALLSDGMFFAISIVKILQSNADNRTSSVIESAVLL